MNGNLKHLVTGLMLTAALACCNKDTTSSSSSTDTTNSSGSNPDPIAVTSCASATGIAKIICLADAFKAQLSATQRDTVQLSYSGTDAVKWSNLPQALVRSPYKRLGLNFGSMTTTQIQYAKALIKEIASTIPN